MVEKNRGFQIFAHTVMILLTLFCLLPFLLLIVSSVTSETSLIRTGYSFFPEELSLDVYRYLLVDSTAITRGYLISAVVTASGTLLNLFLTVMLAYPLSRKDLPKRNLFAFFLFFTMLFNGGLVPTYIMWTQSFHIKNTIFALLVPGLLLNVFNVIMMRTYISANIPDAVIEAARIDGAGEFRLLLQIVIPMSLPIVATLALLAGLAYWNDWLNGLYYITDDRLFSIQVILNRMLAKTEMLKKAATSGVSMGPMPEVGIRMAVAVLGALPVLATYPFFQRYFVKGIAIGAVKG